MGEQIIKLSPVKNPQGIEWEHKYICCNQPSFRKILVSQSSSSIAFLQFVAQDMKTRKLVPSEKYGVQEENNFYVIELGYEEYITSVSGHHCADSVKDMKVLSSLTFGTNVRTYGPFGRPHSKGNEDFNFVMGGSFAGFHGTTRWGKIESFGVFIKVA